MSSLGPVSFLPGGSLDFRVLFESLPGPYLVLSPKLEVLAATDNYLFLTGTTRDKIVGRRLPEILDNRPGLFHESKALIASLKRVLLSRVAESLDPQRYNAPRPSAMGDGFEERYFAPVNTPVLAADGSVGWVVHFLREMPPRARVDVSSGLRGPSGEEPEKSLRDKESLRNEERFHELLDAAPDAFLEVDNEGKIVLVNKAATGMFNFSAEEMIGREVESFVVPATVRETHRRHRSEYVGRPRIRAMGVGLELSAQKKDGTVFPVEISLSPFRAQGQLHVIAIIHDISERKVVEQKLRQAQKLEALVRLAGGAAHEFNNLLTMIMGYAALMISSIDSRDLLIDYVEKMRQATARAGKLTHQLLAFGRRQKLSFRVVDLNSIVADLSQSIFDVTDQKIDCQINVTGDPVWIFADPVQIEQVVLNLLSNARTAMPEGGRITITVDSIQLTKDALHVVPGLPAGEYATLSVTDTGIGMSQEVQSRLFEPFFSTTQDSGTPGMGLAVAYGIVTQCRGTITVQSEVGEGSTFRIYLPLATADEIADSLLPASAIGSLQGNETLMLVEGKPQLLALTAEFLRQNGYTILTAGQAADAVRIADEFTGKIDLLITDLVLPGSDGHRLARKLRTTRPGLLVLFVSGRADTDFEDFSLANDEAFLAKPFTLEELSVIIRGILHRANLKRSNRSM